VEGRKSPCVPGEFLSRAEEIRGREKGEGRGEARGTFLSLEGGGDETSP